MLNINNLKLAIEQNKIILIIVVFSATLISILALTRNTDMEVDIKFGEDRSVNIKGKRSPLPPKRTKVDCLPGEENSQPLNCDSE